MRSIRRFIAGHGRALSALRTVALLTAALLLFALAIIGLPRACAQGFRKPLPDLVRGEGCDR